ncbi:MAG: HAD family hydrolase [Desulfosalsimonas sp.]|uniref:HAD family hydrolase n=1 Tax=Desulfosalsimonas sp. TaxID=3073848 RepID=UPI0039708628
MTALKVAAFDCDGVMFDTEAANRAYYNDILTHFSKPPMTDAEFAYCQMHTADQAIARLFPDAGEFAAARAFRKKRGYGPYIRYMKMAPDLKDVLCWCRNSLNTAVATNRADTMNRVLEEHGLEGCFDLVVTAMDVANPKPHPEQLYAIMDRFQSSPQEVLYIGDSELDQYAAESAGVVFAACGNPGLSADYHIDQLSEIKSIIASRP